MEEDLLLKVAQLANKPVKYIAVAMAQFDTVSKLSYIMGDETKMNDYDRFGLTYEVHQSISDIFWDYLASEATERNVNFLFWKYNVSTNTLSEETLTAHNEKEFFDVDFSALRRAFFSETRQKLTNNSDH